MLLYFQQYLLQNGRVKLSTPVVNSKILTRNLDNSMKNLTPKMFGPLTGLLINLSKIRAQMFSAPQNFVGIFMCSSSNFGPLEKLPCRS
jgi:hypothetical protein